MSGRQLAPRHGQGLPLARDSRARPVGRAEIVGLDRRHRVSTRGSSSTRRGDSARLNHRTSVHCTTSVVQGRVYSPVVRQATRCASLCAGTTVARRSAAPRASAIAMAFARPLHGGAACPTGDLKPSNVWSERRGGSASSTSGSRPHRRPRVDRFVWHPGWMDAGAVDRGRGTDRSLVVARRRDSTAADRAAIRWATILRIAARPCPQPGAVRGVDAGSGATCRRR